jgi:hypothetical protein
MVSAIPPLLSQQRWRKRLVDATFAMGACGMFGADWIARVTGLPPVAIGLCGTLVGCLAFGLGIYLIRCPSCGHSLFWHAISKQSIGRWLHWLLEVNECPRCGYRVEELPDKSVSTP